jgi:hypothetical protein
MIDDETEEYGRQRKGRWRGGPSRGQGKCKEATARERQAWRVGMLSDQSGRTARTNLGLGQSRLQLWKQPLQDARR